MDSFATLKRRATDLMQSLPQSMPNMPNVSLPSMPASINNTSKPKSKSNDTMKGTWERISVPPMPRSSHTVNVVAGKAYIFGGEIRPRQPVDNDMHVVVLPCSGAGADCYAIKAVPASEPVEHVAQEEGVVVEAAKEKGKERDLTDIPLSSPTAATPGGASQSVPGLEGSPTTAAATEADAASLAIPTAASVSSPRLEKGKGRAAAFGPAPPADKVPPPRVGHASAVIGSRIFVFGGRGGPDLKTPLDERGRVWAFDTRNNTWTALDPAPPALPAPLTLVTASVAKPTHPAARSYHCGAATDQPGDPATVGSGGSNAANKDKSGRRRPSTWREWVEGDSAEVGTPQAPIVGNVAARATDEESDGYGTFFVHGGCLADGTRATDVWAFDVRSRVWQQLPDAPGPGRGGSSLCISKSRLYRFGGFNGSTQEGGRLDYLELGVDTFDDVSFPVEEVTVAARGGWKTIAEHPALSVESPPPGEDPAPTTATTTSPLVEPSAEWPGARSVAGLQAVTTGGGREYLVLLLGEREASGVGHEAAGQFWDDVWAFQVPSLDMTPASVTDKLRSVLGRKTGEGRWYRVETRSFDEDEEGEGPGARGWIACSTMGELEENAIVVWGGINAGNRRLGDGWILRLE